MRSGSTRLPLGPAGLPPALAACGVIGRPGDRKPLIEEDGFLYTERMHTLEERFCARVRARAARREPLLEGRALSRAIASVAAGPPALTDEQQRAVKQALGAPIALITGGPGTGKTATAVALLRAVAWTGLSMEQIAVAAPTGKAAQRLADAIAAGLARTRDLADAGLRASAPAPQTLHRLLGWSPKRGRFARHENDPMPQKFIVVDEASMIDLAMMDRLVRALRDDARLVLLGDADQLPSIEAGAVFRDLCAGLGAARLTVNLRVANDANARRITEAARAVNAGMIEPGDSQGAIARRGSVGELTFEGVEHLPRRWSEVGDALLERWWTARVAAGPGFVARAGRTYRLGPDGFGGEDDRSALAALFDDHARARILCATRVRGFAASADTLNDRLLARLRRETRPERGDARGSRRARELAIGAPVAVQHNDYDRGLFNGDQGVVVRVERGGDGDPEAGEGPGARPMAVFPRGGSFDAFPLDVLGDLGPAFATTVHKSQGSEFDHVAIVLPDEDLPLLTRELLYTAITRARRSVLLVGEPELLARAVSRTIERSSGVAERLRRRH